MPQLCFDIMAVNQAEQPRQFSGTSLLCSRMGCGRGFLHPPRQGLSMRLVHTPNLPQDKGKRVSHGCQSCAPVHRL